MRIRKNGQPYANIKESFKEISNENGESIIHFSLLIQENKKAAWLEYQVAQHQYLNVARHLALSEALGKENEK